MEGPNLTHYIPTFKCPHCGDRLNEGFGSRRCWCPGATQDYLSLREGQYTNALERARAWAKRLAQACGPAANMEKRESLEGLELNLKRAEDAIFALKLILGEKDLTLKRRNRQIRDLRRALCK